MDTTLRDGEQTSGVSFSAREKLNIAHLLLQELNVDRIEIASARVINLLAKGSEKHCVYQLKKQPQEHWDDGKHQIEHLP